MIEANKISEKIKAKIDNIEIKIFMGGSEQLTCRLHDRVGAMVLDMLCEGEDVFLEDTELVRDIDKISDNESFISVYEKWFVEEEIVVVKRN